MSGLFGTLNIGKSGLFSTQKVINTISHNIANANTEGYSRQRAELQTTTPSGNNSMYDSMSVGQVGTGVQVSQITRMKDSFLDYQVRAELGVDGCYSGREKFLSEIESVFNEPSDTGLSSLMGSFFSSWQQLSKQSETSNARTVVVEQSKALTNELNHTYTQLQKIKGNAQEVIKQTVFDANKMLGQIDQLNKEIIQVSVAGNNPNDLMDSRDLLLDQLSSKFGISVEKNSFNGINVNTKDDSSANTPTGVNLAQAEIPDKSARIAYVSGIETAKDADGNVKTDSDGNTLYNIEYYKNGDVTDDENRVVVKEVSLTKDQFKELDECRVVWTDQEGKLLSSAGEVQEPVEGTPPTYATITFDTLEKFTPSSGELKGYMSVQEDVDKYIDQLNKLAKAIAYSVNAVHSQSDSFTADASGNVNNFFVNSDIYTTNPAGSPSAQNEEEITAGNITINKDMINDVMLIKTGKDGGGESDGTRALAIAQLQDKLMEVQNITDGMSREDFIEDLCGGLSSDEQKILTISGETNGMKLTNYFKDVVDALGVKAQEAKRMVKNQDVLLKSFEESRSSVSGVSLDEEMANLIQFQHSYQANSKIIATIDELLDVVINGLKR